VARWDLGHEQRKNNLLDVTFWAKIRAVIEDDLESSQQPDLLLWFGEAASNEHFLEAVIQSAGTILERRMMFKTRSPFNYQLCESPKYTLVLSHHYYKSLHLDVRCLLTHSLPLLFTLLLS